MTRVDEADAATAQAFGLSAEEWQDILTRLGRTPTFTEVGVISALWSEHCSYKSSRVHLRTLPTKGPAVLQGPGENAGAVDLGGGLCAVFKIESHNHPSFIEPVQGAATGVGGILRDIFTMGARPIALANSLRFGVPDDTRTPALLAGVVKGIGSYGNAVGVPTVAGEVYFDASYNKNILVNAFALGVCRPEQIVRAVAKGPGNLIVYLGARTGRDGIHGATMASKSFQGDGSTAKSRPTVQVGDPFKEKLLLEACMELFAANCLVGIQDMGAAGLSSSSAEMAARGGVGIELDASKIPAREANMTAYEFMLSESQERMLLCCEESQLPKVLQIAERWDLDAAVIGLVTSRQHLVVRQAALASGESEIAADLPISLLTDDAPVYDRPVVSAPPPTPLDELPWSTDVRADLLALLRSENICSRRWVYEQFDQDVGLQTLRRPGAADAAVLKLDRFDPARRDGVAITIDCNSRYVAASARWGTSLAVMEAYRNLAAAGARGLALSNCLNFGSPKDPVVMGTLADAIAGMGEAATIFETPVISGNVSLYNQTDAEAVLPTPTIAMVGHVQDVARSGRMGVSESDCDVWFISDGAVSLAQSEWLRVVCHQVAGELPPGDLTRAKKVCDAVTGLWEDGTLLAAHDVSEGGALVAAAEMVLAGSSGMYLFDREWFAASPNSPAYEPLFAEGGCRFWLVTRAEAREQVREALFGVAKLQLSGRTTVSTDLVLADVARWSKSELEAAHSATLPALAERDVFARSS